MYYNHNLRTNLQEWKNRLSKASYEQFGNQLKYFLSNIERNQVLSGILTEAFASSFATDEKFGEIYDDRINGSNLDFNNEKAHASFCFLFLKRIIKEHGSYNLHRLTMFYGRDFDDSKNNIMEELINPLVYFLHDSLEKSSSVIYLLEKYKLRTEWFTAKDLLQKYRQAENNFEQIFEDDLRMFLFDQGIDYPFSTPKSSSGRADIIGAIDTSDPVVVEIKIYDRNKGYGKNRIKDGFTQVVKYANDYNKEIGYLVVFNADNHEINFNLSEKTTVFPPMFTFNHKTFYFVIVNLVNETSASKIGKMDTIEIKTDDLV